MRRNVLLLAVVVLALAGCDGGMGDGDQARSTAAPSTGSPTPSVSASPDRVSLPEGTWTGGFGVMIGAKLKGYTIWITLPAECVEGQRCGRQELIDEDAQTCRGPLELDRERDSDGELMFHAPDIGDSRHPGCHEGQAIRLMPEGSTLHLEWEVEATFPITATSTLRLAKGTP